jgi:hypothetical protein
MIEEKPFLTTDPPAEAKHWHAGTAETSEIFYLTYPMMNNSSFFPKKKKPQDYTDYHTIRKLKNLLKSCANLVVESISHASAISVISVVNFSVDSVSSVVFDSFLNLQLLWELPFSLCSPWFND